jgi:hypothetical protein
MTIRYVGDLEPDVVLVLSADQPVDLSSATSVVVEGSVDGWESVLFTRAPSASVADGVKWRLTMPLEAGDTTAVRVTALRAVATWPGGRKQTFPGAALDVRKDSEGIRL